jgi:hypothetical protein
MEIAMPEAFFSAAAWSSRKLSKSAITASVQAAGVGYRRGESVIWFDLQ